MTDSAATRWTLQTADGEHHTTDELTPEEADERFADGQPPVKTDAGGRVPTEKITAYEPKKTYYTYSGY